MPGTIAAECEKFVDTYSEVVINYIVLNLDAEAICKEIKLCSAQIGTPSLVHVPLLKDTKGICLIILCIEILHLILYSE